MILNLDHFPKPIVKITTAGGVELYFEIDQESRRIYVDCPWSNHRKDIVVHMEGDSYGNKDREQQTTSQQN